MGKKGGPKGESAPPWRPPPGKGWSGKSSGSRDWCGKGEGWDGKGWDVPSKGWNASSWDYGKGWDSDEFHGWDGQEWVDDGKEWEDPGWDSNEWIYDDRDIADPGVMPPADAAAGKGFAARPPSAAGLGVAVDAAAGVAPLSAIAAGGYGLGLQIDGSMNESETAEYNKEMLQPYIKRHPASPETTSYCCICEKWPYPTHILSKGHAKKKADIGSDPKLWQPAPWEAEEKEKVKNASPDAAAGAADPQEQQHQAHLQRHRWDQDQLALQVVAEALRVQQEDERRAQAQMPAGNDAAAAAAAALQNNAQQVPRTPTTPGTVNQEAIIDVCNDVVDLVVQLEFKFNGLVNSLSQANVVHATVNHGEQAVEDRSRSPRLRTIDYARRVTQMLSQRQYLNNQHAEAAQAAAQERARQLAHLQEADMQQQLANAAAAAAYAQHEEAMKRQQMANAAASVAKAKAPPTAAKSPPGTPRPASLAPPAPPAAGAAGT